MVSIIVNVYNNKDYLDKCLESVASIDYKSKEVIVVDDGSTDGSGAICDSFAESYPCMRVIHHEGNKGLICARITGWSQAGGSFIMFVDGDDYVHPQILKVMTDAQKEYGADVVCCASYLAADNSVTVDTRSIKGVYDKEGILRIARENILYDSLLQKSGMPLHWFGKLFRLSLLEGSIQKAIGLSIEDMVPVLDIIVNKCQKLVCLDEPLYYYRQHPVQISKRRRYHLFPDYIKIWGLLDSIGGDYWSEQLSVRIFKKIRPSYQRSYHRYVAHIRLMRNSEVVKKYLWDKKDLPRNIKRHPHYLLVKHRLYWLDYLYYCVFFKR